MLYKSPKKCSRMSSRVSSRKSSVCLPKFCVRSLGCAPEKFKSRSALSLQALLSACPPVGSSCLLAVSQRFQAVSQVFSFCLHPLALLTVPRRSSSPNSPEDGLETNENYAQLLLRIWKSQSVNNKVFNRKTVKFKPVTMTRLKTGNTKGDTVNTAVIIKGHVLL